jgi:hypothetical protein
MAVKSPTGPSLGAKTAVERAAALVETVPSRELRNFTRWRAPPLMVAIGERSFNTADWSLGGAMVAEVENRGWKCGQTINVKIGLPKGELRDDQMVIVRYSPEQRQLAIRSRSTASVLTEMKRECDAAGVQLV